MKTLYLVTGADGHLGSTIIRLLRKQNRTVRGLLIPGKNAPDIPGVRYFHGDVRDLESMRPLFENAGCRELAVIHTAGMISIAENVTPELYEVNVNGTKNIISLCFQYKVKRLLYVSSVHAIPEQNKLKVLHETTDFSLIWWKAPMPKQKPRPQKRYWMLSKKAWMPWLSIHRESWVPLTPPAIIWCRWSQIISKDAFRPV
ncbi:MAG: NAD-dependent epimerase/dehydratase family protein [Blautia marasmi]